MAGMVEPIWTPDPDRAASSGMASFLAAARARTDRRLDDTVDLQAWSVADPGGFWSLVWDELDVIGDKGSVAHVESVLPDAVFFPEARLNIAENLLRDRPDEVAAVIATAEAGNGLGVVATLSSADLAARVAAVATLLRDRGVRPGDRVGLVVPVGVDALVVTLAALAVGAVVSSAAPEFGVPAVLDRFGQLDPAVLVAATAYRWGGRTYDRSEHVVELVRGLPSVREVLLVPPTDDVSSPVDAAPPDVSRISALAVAGSTRLVHVDALADVVRVREGATPPVERLPFDHPAYVLFSSGTTGAPKCLVHRAGGVLVKHLVEQRLLCDVRPGDRVMFFTTTGWMMWNWAVSVLATGATLVLHDGAPNHPDLLGLFRVASLTEVTHLGLSARLLDGIRAAGLDPRDAGPLDHLRVVMVTGSALSATTATWLQERLGPGVQLAPISGGTDLVGCFVGSDPTRPVRAGEMQGPVLGMDVDVFDDDGRSLRDRPGVQGELVCRNAFPTVPLGIWGDADGSRLRSTYFERWPGVWAHGDLASWTEDGGIVIHGRSDATLNAGGVRIGTGELYAALEHVPEVADALAFGQSWDDDTRVVLLVVTSTDLDDDLRDRIRRTIRERCSPRHVPAVVARVTDLPRTHSGKLAEIAVGDAVNGRPVRNRDALANPETLDAIVALDDLRA
jgi:acetoacetyl-CoA synthetase